MKLHLPVLLRKAVLTCFSVVSVCTLYSGGIVAAADLTLAEADSLVVDYADSSSITDLSGGTLALAGGTELLLQNCGEGDGKTYTLLTGVSSLLDAEGNPLTLTDENNAALLYFDTTQPGTGFWGGGWLQLTSEGHVQLVLHGGEVQEALTISTRQTGSKTYNYYEGICFRDITYTLSGTSSAFGGAIYGSSSSTITLSNNGSVVFSGNSASFFSTSSTSAWGGAIYGDSHSTVTLSNNGSVTFTGNEASSSAYRGAYGGAIYGGSNSTITLCNNGSVVFEGNTASSCGQISGDTITLSNNGIEVLELLYDIARGGAIHGDTITLSNNGSVVFEGNTASSFDYASGGAIDGITIDLNNNASVSFIENIAGVGGAICGDAGSTITMSDNGSVEFNGNSASHDSGIARGGAIYGDYDSTIALSNNGSVVFEGNTASSLDYTYGGAIYGDTITLSNNGSVKFIGNTSSGNRGYGGAIHGDTITLSNNGSVTFSGNNASGDYARGGGAIYTDGSLHIRNNDSVEFSGNVEQEGSAYRLRSVYVSGGSDDVLNISAAAGKSVTFYDTIYVSSGTTVNLNADYEDAEGNIIEQKGDILFTGATTVDDLYKAKGNVAGTEEEIRLSRTTEVKTMTNLYGGRLRVEDGAIYQGYGITAHEGSEATVRVKDATLSHSGYDLIFNAGTTLELAGTNSISGNVQMLEGSILSFDGTETQGVTGLTGNLGFTGAPIVSLGDTPAWTGENHALLYVSGTISGWDADTLTVLGSAYGSDNLYWLNNDLLVLNYNAETFNPHFRGDIVITSRQQGPAGYKYFADASFENITGASAGGAIYGDDITLSNNGIVTFSGNSASDFGGAIYGGNGSIISLNNNGRVEFIGNTASYDGGAIYGGNGSIISLNNNGSVEFSGNSAHGTGAIFGYEDGTISLNNNGSVSFCENSECAIYGYGASTITLSGNNSVEFNRNDSAIIVVSSRTPGPQIRIKDNGRVSFIANTERGAILMTVDLPLAPSAGLGCLTLSGNDNVEFIGNRNTFDGDGGAIGGAIITLSDNGSVTFSGNTASGSSYAFGGAIYGGNLSIQNNGAVLFEKNVAKSGSSYCLNSIVAGGGGDDIISLSAAAGKSIEFRDSVYIDSYTNTVKLNADYTDAEGVIHKQAGDIIFTGAYTEAHLNELLAADGAERTATEEEILNSRTTTVYAMTNLYGGRLRVEDGAIYKGRGIMVHEGSGATVRVKDATLSHSGYDLTFNAGTTLELEGSNSITGNVQMLEGSTMRLKNAVVVNGVILPDFNAGTTLELVGANSITGDVRMLEGSTLRLVFDDPTANKLELQLSDTLTLKAGSQVQRAGADGKVTLLGDGTLRMEGSADFSAFSLGKTWAGTVSLADITTEADLKMTTIGHAGSTIELENVMGYTGVNGGTVAADLQLNRSTAAGGTEQAALVISNGYSHKTNADHVMTTFSGTVSGAGKMVYEKTLSNEYTGFAFSGDVSGWTGAFEMNGGKTFNLVFNGNATEIKADIRDVSSGGTLNLVLGADAAMTLSGAINTDSITVSNAAGASFCNTVSTGTLSAAGSAVTFGAAATVSGDMNATAVVLNQGCSLDVGGALSAGQVTLKELSTTAPTLTVGSFAAGDTIFSLDVDALNALNLGHGQSVVIARADSAIGSDFAAWLAEGSTTLDAVVYRYDLSVSGSDVMVSMDYANCGTRIWYGNAWVGKESWKEYMTAGHDAVNGVETVDLGGADIVAAGLYIAPDSSSVMTVLSNGMITAEYTEVANGKLTIAEDVELETPELAADGREILLQGKLIVSGDGSIGQLSGTEGTLEIDGKLSVDSDVTLGSLVNGGTLDMGTHKLNVAGACRYAGNVTAGEVVMHNRTNNYVEFDTLVADKVKVTNAFSSASYSDNISVGDGSAIGELVAETLEVRGGTVTLGRSSGGTEMSLLNLDLREDATLVLNQQTALAVTDTLTATENATVQLKKDASICYGDTSISNRNESGTMDVNAYALSGKADLVLERAHVSMRSSSAKVVDYQLINSSVENAGTGTLQLTHAGNSLTSIAATSGSVEVYNQAELNLEHLSIGRNQSLAVMSSDVAAGVDEEFEARVNIFGSATFGADSTLIADLSIQSGATIRIEGVVHMGSSITLSSGMVLAGAAMENALSLNVAGDYVVLFDGVDSLILDGETPLVYSPGGLTVDDKVLASKYFMGLEEMENLYITFEENSDSESGNSSGGEVRLTLGSEVIPEPTTSTLSLLALAALAARRRRK